MRQGTQEEEPVDREGENKKSNSDWEIMKVERKELMASVRRLLTMS